MDDQHHAKGGLVQRPDGVSHVESPERPGQETEQVDEESLEVAGPLGLITDEELGHEEGVGDELGPGEHEARESGGLQVVVEVAEGEQQLLPEAEERGVGG